MSSLCCVFKLLGMLKDVEDELQRKVKVTVIDHFKLVFLQCHCCTDTNLLLSVSLFLDLPLSEHTQSTGRTARPRG